MAATYARDLKAQSGTGVQRVAFPKGKMFGHLEVLEESRYHVPFVLCRCTVTDETIRLCPSSLYVHKLGRRKWCPCCAGKNLFHGSRSIGSGRPVKPKMCGKCCDLAHRRPVDRKCVCGERYAPEVIAIDLDNRNPGNLAIVSESRRRVEVTCNP